MKKTYISPILNVVTINVKATIMAASTLDIINDPTDLDGARSRYFSTDWDEEEDEDM